MCTKIRHRRSAGVIGATLLIALAGPLQAQPINTVSIGSVSSELTEGPFLRAADNLINGSGKNPNGPGTHVDGNPESYGGTMWLTDGVGFPGSTTDDTDPFVTFDLGGTFDLTSVTIWNYNETQPWTPRGVDQMEIEISTDGGSSFALFSTINLQQAPANNTTVFAETFSLSGANGVTHVQFDILSNHRGDTFINGNYVNGGNGDSGHVGLSEVEFDGIVLKEVLVDVKPGSDPNCFNINGHGVIPVAILGSATFDVLNIDTSTLYFAGLEVRVRGNKGPLCHGESSNGDGFLDLVCQFEDDPSIWVPDSSANATLTGSLLDGTKFKGTDSICVVP